MVDKTPGGPHQAAVAAQVKPFIDGEIASGVVIGLYDAGHTEVYGFGTGPGGKPPGAETLFEIGSVTKVYTSLLLADAIQRRELSIDSPVSELLPPGVTVPTRDKQVITLRHLVLHSSGLPRQPPAVAAHPEAQDPYAGYGEDALYADLVHTDLETTPGTKVLYSNYGAGLLGFALGRKIGGGYGHAVTDRVLVPLGLKDTYLGVPPAAAARRATGTDADLSAVPAWTYDAMAGAGGLISTAHDQLALIAAEVEAAGGSKAPLRAAMHFTQEDQLEEDPQHPGNIGLGWQIDEKGRYWHNGGTGGFHAFLGFDPQSKRGIVILASTSTSMIDRLADAMYDVLAGKAEAPAIALPSEPQLAALAGHYQVAGGQGNGPGMTVGVVVRNKRLYLQGPQGFARMAPISDHEFEVEQFQSLAFFESDGGKVARLIFVTGGPRIIAQKID